MKSPARAISILFLLLLTSTTALSQQASMTILHTNDTHGHLLPFSYPGSAEYSTLEVRKNIGGIARRATLVKRLREQLGRQGIQVWLVDAGDFTDGTPFSAEYQGEADIAAMNAATYDFGTLGNHEFNRPLATLKKLLNLFQYPMLCANTVGFSPDTPLRESAIREVGPLKIGIFGLVTTEYADYQSLKEGIRIVSEIETAKRMASALRPKADIVIALSHAGEKVDAQIAATVPGIDIIVGGHSHSRLPSGELIWHSDQLKAKEVNGTIIVQAYQWGGELGRLDLLFDKDEKGAWHVVRYRARLLPITSDLPEDPVVAAVVARYWKPISARYGEVIGKAAGDFMDRGDDFTAYNLLTDSTRETYKTQIGIDYMGGIRPQLVEGNILLADLACLDPFNNSVVTFKITGSKLKELITKIRPAVSGIRYRIENGKLTEASVGGQPIQDAGTYSGATSSFFAEAFLKGIETNETGKRWIDAVVDYIRKKGIVKPSYDGRRVIIPQ
jgi:5'-nucleotidase/UDP-sugar diphosphatase